MKTRRKRQDFTAFSTFSSRKRSESADSLNPYETYGQIDEIPIKMMEFPLFSENSTFQEKLQNQENVNFNFMGKDENSWKLRDFPDSAPSKYLKYDKV